MTAAAGVLVGVLRRLFRLPAKLPGTVEELKDQRVEPSTVPKAVAVSLVSLAGGSSLGPEDALGRMGGGLGTWVSERKKLSEDMRATNMSPDVRGVGGLLSAQLFTTILVLSSRARRALVSRSAVRGSAGLVVAFTVLSDPGRLSSGSTRCLLQVRGLTVLTAVPLAWSPGRRADHDGRDRDLHAARRSSRDRTIFADDRGVAFGLVGVALPLTCSPASAHHRDRRWGGARRRALDRGRVRADPCFRSRGHRLIVGRSW